MKKEELKQDTLKKRFDAMTDALNDERLRWLFGKSKTLSEKEMKYEEYEIIVEKILQTEMERKMIIRELKTGNLVTSEIAKRVNLPPKKVFDHLKMLGRSNIVMVSGERDEELEFQLLL